ncbi:MAG: cupin domain-containing protein [Burkholderiales bacterium]|nr:cupin domain-containing protein [Burkholderiales bacterium]
MEQRVARFDALTPLPIQKDASIPLAALDLVYARKLLPVLGRDGGGDTPITSSAPIRGAAGITMTYAVCPPGQGPGLHAHKATYETFVVMQGDFEFTWGEAGEHAMRLTRLDVLSVPPGVTRAFRNVGAGEGILLVVISGGEHNMQDIHMPAVAAQAIHAASPAFLQRLADSGITHDPLPA